MQKEKFYIGIGLLILICAAVLSGIKFFSGEDNWACKNGEWVRHGSSFAPKPNKECPKLSELIQEVPKVEEKKDKPEIVVDSPLADEELINPVKISGKALGSWFFEASFPIKIMDENGKTISSGIAQAQEDWMSEDYVPFTAELNFDSPTATSGYIIFERDTPSGIKELEKTYRLPIKLPAPKEEMTVKIFLGNKKMNPDSKDCSLVFPIERKTAKTASVAKASLEEMLKGVTKEEEGKEYYSSINSGVKINSLAIASGTAWVDFDGQIEKEVGGSCRVTAIRSQIESTLKQFPNVKEVVISVEGKVEEALQP